VIETEDGDYVVSGVTESFGQKDSDIWVLKIRPDGTISTNAPAGFGIDTDADIVDLNDFTVYEWPLRLRTALFQSMMSPSRLQM